MQCSGKIGGNNMNKKIVAGAFGASLAGTFLFFIGNIILKGSKFSYEYAKSVKKLDSKTEMKLEKDGVYSLRKLDSKPIKILQLTDMHIGGGYLSRHEDKQALTIMNRVIESTKPDCIILTGDLVCSRAHITWSRNNLNSIKIITTMLENIGIPYAVTFGNHDVEPKATHSKWELCEFLCKQEHCLMVQYDAAKNITGYSNYPIKLRNRDGSLNSVLYMIDSNEYLNENKKRGYDYIHDDQVDWYAKEVKRIEEEEGRNIPSFIYTHIPLKEYAQAWDDVLCMNTNVRYYYGSGDEKVSCSKYESKLFNTVVNLGSTKGIFCGHDHLNDFSIEYKGVRLTYGQSIDCLLYAKNLAEHKGGTELKIYKDDTFSIKGRKYRRKI